MDEKILVTLPSFSETARAMLETLGTVMCAVPLQEDLDRMIGEYTVVVVGLGLTFHKETLEKAVNLKVIATATTGLDHIDVNYAKQKGIAVLCLRDEHEFLDTITGTAELAFGLMIDLVRGMTAAHTAVVERGEWVRENFRGTSLYGKTLGIIGMGRLGKIMASGAQGFRMRVMYYDPNVAQTAFPQFTKVTLEELLEASDVIAIHVHLNADTEGMLGQNEFALMKHGVKIVNTSRGKIVDEIELLKALQDGIVGGYATDVLADELDFKTDASQNPLVQYAKNHSNVLITPHIGGMTTDSRIATDDFIVRKLFGFLQGW